MASGPERHDESIRTSLRELKALEDERIEREHQADAKRVRDAQQRRAEAERRERAQLDAQSAADAAAREQARVRLEEEEARREAMSRAAVEQARIAVEARTRAEESERERRHEIKLQRMRREPRPRGLGALVASGVAGATIAIAGCLIVIFGVVKPASDRRLAEGESALSMAEIKERSLERRIDEQRLKLLETERALESARSERSVPPPLMPPRVVVPVPKHGLPPHTTTSRASDPTLTPCGGPGDPLCP